MLAALAASVVVLALRQEREPERPETYILGDRLEQYAPAVEGRLLQAIAAAGLGWPPGEFALVASKDSRKLEVYGRERDDGAWRYVRDYPVLAARSWRSTPTAALISPSGSAIPMHSIAAWPPPTAAPSSATTS